MTFIGLFYCTKLTEKEKIIMGLITKEIEVILNNKVKWYKDKGYIIPTIINKEGKSVIPRFTKLKVDVNDLMDNSNLKVDYECDCCKEINAISWNRYKKQLDEKGKVYCHKCSIKLYGAENIRRNKLKKGTSFEQWCIDNSRQDLLDRWDYELNEYKPNEVSKGTTKKYGSNALKEYIKAN